VPPLSRSGPSVGCGQVRDKKDKDASTYLMKMMDEVVSTRSHSRSNRPAKIWGAHHRRSQLIMHGVAAQVEQEKTVLGDVEDPKMQVEEMALKVFVKADNQYYAGKADLSTAKTFRSAATLMEVCRQFGELDIDVAEKYKYAKVKARDIMIAAKEGRTLQPPEPEPAEAPAAVGMPLDEEDEGDDETMPPPNHPPPAQDANSAGAAGRTAFLDIPSVPQEPPRVVGGAPSPDPVRAPSPPIIDVPPPAEDGPNAGRVQRTPKIRAVLKAAAKPKAQIPTAELVQAEKAAKCALSALQFEDVRGAVGYLQQALATLTDAD
jgi:vacuolar protein sorting-associated protein VTA1